VGYLTHKPEDPTMRRLIPLVLALGALVALAAPAAAVKPDRYATPYDDLLLEGLCTFDVHIEITLDRAHAIDFYDQDGNLVRTVFSGSLGIRVTNVDTEAAVDLNVGGPAISEYHADGTSTMTFLGLGLPLLTDSNLTRGRFSFVFSADGSEVSATFASGFTQDLCALLEG
jgi:hypothetical protein